VSLSGCYRFYQSRSGFAYTPAGIVVPPYAKAVYVSPVNHDFGSILKFIETVFNLPTVGPGGGYADSRADDLSDCFDFNQSPLPFTTIQAPLDAQHFLNDKSPPTPPDND